MNKLKNQSLDLPILLIILIISPISAIEEDDVKCLKGIKSSLKDPQNKLTSWNFSSSSARVICIFEGASCWNTRENRLLSLQLSDFQLSGNIPDSLQYCNSLHTLDLSGNALTGSIPAKICSWFPFLVALDLSNNKLSGQIPPDLGQCQYLNKLVLSRNSLSGTIPSQLSDLIRLEEFSVANNNLNGLIPASFGNFDEAGFIGNNGLCGKPLGGKCGADALSKKSIIAISIVCFLFFIACLYAALVYITKKNPNVVESESSESLIWEKEVRFTFREIVRVTNGFDDYYCIGKGGFGSVYKASLASGLVVAVKKLNISESSSIPQINKRSFENEIRALTEIRHRNIIKLYGYCSRKGAMFLVYDYVEKGSLGNMLCNAEAKLELGWERRLNIIRGLAHAVAYLHHDCIPPIVHRDISINNILVDDDCEPRLSDFGTAKFLSSGSFTWTFVAGSYGYMAPELDQTMRVTPKCDVYSYGVIVLEVLMGKHPGDVLTALSDRKAKVDILLKDALDQHLLSPTGRNAKEIVLAVTLALLCTSAKPESRPTMRYVVQKLSSRATLDLSEPFQGITLGKLKEHCSALLCAD